MIPKYFHVDIPHQKTPWNTSNTVIVIQRQGRVVTDYKNACLVLYNYCPLVKLAPKSMGQVIQNRFLSQ